MATVPFSNPYLPGYDVSRYVEHKKTQLRGYFKPGSWFSPVSYCGETFTDETYQVKSDWSIFHYEDGKFLFTNPSGDAAHKGFIYANRTMATLLPNPLTNNCPTREELEKRYPVGTLYTPVNLHGEPCQVKAYVSPKWRIAFNKDAGVARFVDKNVDEDTTPPGYIWTRYKGVDHYAKVSGKIELDSVPSWNKDPLIVKEEKPLVVERPPLELVSVSFRKI